MEGFDTVRTLARLRHEEACAAAGGKRSAADLLEGATAITDIERSAVADEDPILCGAEAVLDPSVDGIFYKAGVSKEQAAFYQAHEFGHHFLDSATGACTGTDIDVTMPEERIPLGIQRVEGYGPANGGNARRMSSPENSCCPAAKRDDCSQRRSFPPRTSQSGSEFLSGWCISSWRRPFSCRQSKTLHLHRPEYPRWTIPRRLPQGQKPDRI